MYADESHSKNNLRI